MYDNLNFISTICAIEKKKKDQRESKRTGENREMIKIV